MAALTSPRPPTLKRSMGPWMAKWLAKGFMLLLFGIPVFVWMKWRQRIAENDRAWDDSAFALKQQHTPPPKPPVHVGSGVE